MRWLSEDLQNTVYYFVLCIFVLKDDVESNLFFHILVAFLLRPSYVGSPLVAVTMRVENEPHQIFLHLPPACDGKGTEARE